MNAENELRLRMQELNDVAEYTERLKGYLEKDTNNNTLRENVTKKEQEMEVLYQKIAILQAMLNLEDDYENDRPIYFHYVDGGLEDDIELGSNDVNYEKAYKQQSDLLRLNYDYLSHRSLNYSGMKIDYGDAEYDKNYALMKEEILKTKPTLQAGYEGKHFKSKEVEVNSITTPSFGGQHFTPNDLNSNYVVFKKDGYLNIVGNFTEDFIKNNLDKLDSDLAKDYFGKIRLWNNLDYGVNPLNGMDAKVKLDRDGNAEVIGDVDDINYHKANLKKNLYEGKHFKGGLDEDAEKQEDIPLDKDMSGLDVIPDMVDDEDSKDMSGLDKIPTDLDESQDIVPFEPANPVNQVKGRKITRKKAKPSLIQKFKSLKTWQKALIVAGAIAVVGVGVFVIGPHIIDAVNQAINPEHVNTVHNTVNTVNNAVNSAPSLDYSGIGEGHTVFTNAYDAAGNTNGLMSNEFFSNNPLDVFNTATNSYMGLTPEQLNDPSFMAELAKDPNNALLFGNSMADPSGFVGLDDIVSEITKSGIVK